MKLGQNSFKKSVEGWVSTQDQKSSIHSPYHQVTLSIVLYSVFSILIFINAIHYQFVLVNMVDGPTPAGGPPPRGPATLRLFYVGLPSPPPSRADNWLKKAWKHGFEPKTFNVHYILLTTKLHFHLCLVYYYNV
jgi:hypothetical protein